MPPQLPVCGMLRPARRGIFPVLLASIRGEVEDVVDEQQPVHAASGGAVGPVDILAIAQEHAEHEAAVRAAVASERCAMRRHERHRPAHPLLWTSGAASLTGDAPMLSGTSAQRNSSVRSAETATRLGGVVVYRLAKDEARRNA